MAIQWDKKLEVGNDRIDFEHRIFVDLLKILSELQPSEKEKAIRLIEEVEKYATFHFFSEENIMIDIGFPDYEVHKQAHKQLLSIFGTKRYDYQNEHIDLAQLIDFMFDWFALHTSQVDQELADYIVKHNDKV